MIYALAQFWARTVACFTDPIRLRHFIWRCVEGYVGGAVVLLFVWWEYGLAPRAFWQWVALVTTPGAAPLAEYLVYEYFIEPWARSRAMRGLPSTAGPYFERGPRDGETFIHP